MKNQIIHLSTFIRNIRYNKFTLFVFYFKHIVKVYLQLKPIKKDRSKIYSEVPLFILNACINPFDNLKFANYSAPNNLSDRFEQVIEGIKSVKEFFLNSEIVYIENSTIPNEYENEIKSLVDYYFNFSNNNLLQFSREFNNKGVPWSMANLLCLIEINKIKQYNSYHFLNGRYKVSLQTAENFYSHFKKGFMHVKMKKHNITTIYFYFTDVSLTRIFKIFKFSHLCSVSGFSIEDLFSVFFLKKRYLSNLGISGKINSVQKCEE